MCELKACPFCNSKDLTVNSVYEELKSGYDSVECNNCFVEVFGAPDVWNTRAQSEWVSLSDELPPLNKKVFLYIDGGIGEAIGVFDSASRKFKVGPNKHYQSEILGWMPRPTPPKGD